MSEYIERGALVKRVANRKLIFEESTPVEEAVAEQLSVFLEEIEAATAADVVEVKHGFWTGITTKDIAHAEGVGPNATEGEREAYREWFKHITHCSVCEKMFDDRQTNTWKHCPECGAKMDGERREEK